MSARAPVLAVVPAGSLEAAKWLALAAMLVDHVNAVFYGRELGLVADVVGRLAFPLFAIVAGVNLARPGRDLTRAAGKFAAWCLVALPFHAALFAQVGGWWPINILGTFAVAALVLHLVDQGRLELAGLVFLAGGALVEYWWPGVGLVVAVALVARSPNPALYGLPLVLAAGTLCIVNGNAYALLAAPLAAWLTRWAPELPRSPRAFWWAYPGHLAALVLAAELGA